jgi:hypothetical protein
MPVGRPKGEALRHVRSAAGQCYSIVEKRPRPSTLPSSVAPHHFERSGIKKVAKIVDLRYGYCFRPVGRVSGEGKEAHASWASSALPAKAITAFPVNWRSQVDADTVLSRIDDSCYMRKTTTPAGLNCSCWRSVSPQAAGGERGTLMHIVGYAQGIVRIKDGLIEGSEGGLP